MHWYAAAAGQKAAGQYIAHKYGLFGGGINEILNGNICIWLQDLFVGLENMKGFNSSQFPSFVCNKVSWYFEWAMQFWRLM